MSEPKEEEEEEEDLSDFAILRQPQENDSGIQSLFSCIPRQELDLEEPMILFGK